jgi:hypothetical protein
MNERDPLQGKPATLILDLPLEQAEVVMDILEDVLLTLREAYDARLRLLHSLREEDPASKLENDADTPF